MGAKSFEGAVVVVSDVAECLASFLSDLVEAISFEEMQFQRLQLVVESSLRSLLKRALPASSLIDI